MGKVNIRLTDKIDILEDFIRQHKKGVLAGSLAVVMAFIGTIVYAIHNNKGKDEVPPPPPPGINQTETEYSYVDLQRKADSPYLVDSRVHSPYEVTVDEGTRITAEPRKGSAYVGTVRFNNEAELVTHDDEWACIKYNVPQEKYNYDTDIHDHTRLGWVPIDTVHYKGDKLPSGSAVDYGDTCYVHFDRTTKIRNGNSDNDILTSAAPGHYARVNGYVPKPEWDDSDVTYVVTYTDSKGNTFVGYMQGENGEFIPRNKMMDIINTECRHLVVTGNDVNVRQYPTTNSLAIGELNKGDSPVYVETIFADPNWYHITIDDGTEHGKDGYVSSAVKCVSVESEPRKQIPPGLQGLGFEKKDEVQKTP